MSAFNNARARRDFWLFAAATFACFTTNSTLALLALVLKQKGWSADVIGLVLSAPAVPIVVSMLLAGLVIARFGAWPVIAGGAFVMLASFVSLEFTADSFAGAVASRVAHGIGYALFVPAAMLYADSRLAPRHKVYYFGIYASMLPLPNVLGPFLGETYLRVAGIDQFFLYMALPACLGVALVFALKPGVRPPVQRHHLNDYGPLLRHRGLWSPYGGIFVVGAFYGFVVSFMALLLEARGVAVSYFFVTFTLCLFGSRFLLVRYLQRLPRALLVAAALGLLSAAYVVLAFATSVGATVLAGVLFGLGYSAAYPTFSVWVTQQFPPDKQSLPLTLYNAVFTLGIFVLPLIGGYVIAWLGMERMVVGMAAAGFVVAVAIFAANRTAPAAAPSP